MDRPGSDRDRYRQLPCFELFQHVVFAEGTGLGITTGQVLVFQKPGHHTATVIMLVHQCHVVLLVIFMVTAPLLMQGVKVELPEADSNFQPNG